MSVTLCLTVLIASFFLAVVSGLPASGAAAPQAAYLRCEYHENPLGIDTAKPRLSWIVQSDRRGERQTAYHILVASTPEALAEDRGDLWDTGKVDSAQTIQVEYDGKPLQSNDRCFWKVRVWDRDGEPTEWSKPAAWSMGLLKPSDWKAQWIGCDIPHDQVENPVYLPCPFLRKSFHVARSVRRATVYATAAGLYELYINGRRVGRDYFTPGWTEYDKRLYYQTYDITNLVKGRADNVIGAILGDGWYGLHHGGRGQLGLLAQIRLEYADGATEEIVTDGSWKTTYGGPIRMADIYNGESYDARKEMPDWSAPGFDDSAWKPVTVGFRRNAGTTWNDVTEKLRQVARENSLEVAVNNETFGDPAYGFVKSLRVEYRQGGRTRRRTVPEGGTLRIDAGGNLVIVRALYGADASGSRIAEAPKQAHPGSPVRRTQEIKPIGIKEPKPGVFVYDLGQNFAGWARLKVKGSAGQKVTLRFAEMLNPDGTIYTTNLRGAKCTDTYVLKGGGEEVWEPRFTFHGFRYVEVTGFPGAPKADAITGVVLNSDAPRTSAFECSSKLLNRLYQNIVWGQRSNYLEVPTDCPQRDERMGWSGDAQAFIGTATYNMDVAAFFTAWMNTFNDCQDPEGGYPNVAPRGGGVSPAWGDAGIICPWTLYRMYGDTRIIAAHYEGMARWLDYLEKRSAGYLRPAEGFGDWLNVHDEMPKDVIATAYFAHVARLMSEMAEAVGRKDDAVKYRQLFEKIRDAYDRAYVSEDGRIKGDTQTTYLMALGFDLLPADMRRPAANRLLELIEARNGHLSTGFLGVNLLLPVLTEIGRPDVAWRLLTTTTYPSWLYSVTQGATTIWERWDGWTQEKGFQDPGMNSFNHYAYGSCGQWMFSTLAGIDTDGPAFEKIVIHPRPGGGVTFARASYDSLRGRIATAWKVEGARFTLDVTIPANTTATVFVPAKDAARVTESGKPASKAEGVRFLRMEDGCAVFAVGSGRYSFVSQGGVLIE
jgi:alpha-L-rhamnosidase